MTTLNQLAPKLLEVIEEAQGALAHYVTPSTREPISHENLINQLLSILDDEELCKAIREVRESQKASEMVLEKFHPESSQVTRTKFIPELNILEVEFKSNGKVYHYDGFEYDTWKLLLNAESIGSFINKEVKGKYNYRLIDAANASAASSDKKNEQQIKASEL